MRFIFCSVQHNSTSALLLHAAGKLDLA